MKTLVPSHSHHLRGWICGLALALVWLAVVAAVPAAQGGKMSFALESPAFKAGDTIPVRHTCHGEDLSPVLKWTDPPAGTKSLVLVVDDPDAPRGTWLHWTIWNIPPTLRSLSEGVPKRPEGPDGSRQGKNDFGKPGWGGPCPPPGPPHRYFFKLLALDAPLDLPAGAAKSAFNQALAGRTVLGQAELIGRFGSQR